MIGNVLAGVGTSRRTALCLVLSLGLFACITTHAASAADCPGHPDALGTSRTLVVDPREHPRIGAMQYPETLPLADHEVVLTFDDGPLPRNSDQVLEILAAQCVKATFFTIGRMAHAYPEGVRKLRDAGHSIGTHSQNHPLNMGRMPVERARQEIDDGIASVKAALGDDAALAPFFRIPGLARAEDVEEYLASQGIQTWSSDFLADDWRHIPSSRVFDLAMKRLDERGRGILLLHDIQARTVAALPRILNELKVRGYRIVHVVPATSELSATPTDPQQWQLHPASETVAISHWPRIPNFLFAGAETLSAPSLSDFDWLDGRPMAFTGPFDRARGMARGVAPPRESPWPLPSPLALDNMTIALPVPAQGVFEIQEGLRAAAATFAPSSRRAERTDATEHRTDRAERRTTADAGDIRGINRGKHHAGGDSGRTRRFTASRAHSRGNRPTAHAGRGKLKHLVQVKKRNV
jgi:peptidoglycan/xylan/chitin deacetylase (PgdA/CDA1 family)